MMTNKWDIHNHILYGIDDGSSCMEETVNLLEEEYRQGVRNIIFTPHLRKNMFEAPFEAKEETFRLVVNKYNQLLKQDMPGMHFYLGCEFHVHPTDEIPFENKKILMPGGQFVLSEFSTSDTFRDIFPVARRFKRHQIRCIIAHAERYRLKAEQVKILKEQYDVLIQLNASCILGKEGLGRKILARKILAMNLADFIASDAHDTEERTVMLEQCYAFVEKKYGRRYAKELFSENAERIFGENY